MIYFETKYYDNGTKITKIKIESWVKKAALWFVAIAVLSAMTVGLGFLQVI